MTRSNERFCVVCGELLPESVSKNASTHPGDCRAKNTQTLLTKHNKHVKISKIRAILTFLEDKFAVGIDIDTLTNMLCTVNMYHTTIDDFTMTAYYLVSNECDGNVTIRDLSDVADEWDNNNGQKRLNSLKDRVIGYARTIEKQFDTSEIYSILKSAIWRSDIVRYISRTNISPSDARTRRIRQVLTRIRNIAQTKFGYSKTAYKILKQMIGATIGNTDDRVHKIIIATTTDLSVESDVVSVMLQCYDENKHRLIGRDVVVIAGGIMYYVSRRSRLGISQETIAMALKTSALSIRKIYTILTTMSVIDHDKNEHTIHE